MTYRDTNSTTSSPESEDGQHRLDLQHGPTISQCGQEAAHASLSVLPDDKKVKAMKGTYGQHGSASSASIALQQSLESKLRQQLPTGGLMMFMKGWKVKAAPSGRRYFQLAQSVRPIKETDCGLWRTPTSRNNGGGWNHNPMTTIKKMERGQTIDLADETALFNLPSAMWPTPASRDYKDTGDLSKGMVRKDGKLRNDTLGRVVYGLTAQTENKGSLNPAFPCWLMGYSTESLSSMQSAMQSYRKSRQNLSKREDKPMSSKI